MILAKCSTGSYRSDIFWLLSLTSAIKNISCISWLTAAFQSRQTASWQAWQTASWQTWHSSTQIISCVDHFEFSTCWKNLAMKNTKPQRNWPIKCLVAKESCLSFQAPTAEPGSWLVTFERLKSLWVASELHASTVVWDPHVLKWDPKAAKTTYIYYIYIVEWNSQYALVCHDWKWWKWKRLKLLGWTAGKQATRELASCRSCWGCGNGTACVAVIGWGRQGNLKMVGPFLHTTCSTHFHFNMFLNCFMRRGISDLTLRGLACTEASMLQEQWTCKIISGWKLWLCLVHDVHDVHSIDAQRFWKLNRFW